jgi:hypothetical protein
MWTKEEDAGVSYAMNHYSRQVMIGNHLLEPLLKVRVSAQIDGPLPSCQSSQTASVDGEFQASDFLRGMRSSDFEPVLHRCRQ